jgi:endonuclease YncB( thermonuclease family)
MRQRDVRSTEPVKHQRGEGMRQYRPATFLVLLLALLSAHAETLSCRVVRVTDGDTIVVLEADKVHHKIRLQGIDAPERRQAPDTPLGSSPRAAI